MLSCLNMMSPSRLSLSSLSRASFSRFPYSCGEKYSTNWASLLAAPCVGADYTFAKHTRPCPGQTVLHGRVDADNPGLATPLLDALGGMTFRHRRRLVCSRIALNTRSASS